MIVGWLMLLVISCVLVNLVFWVVVRVVFCVIVICVIVCVKIGIGRIFLSCYENLLILLFELIMIMLVGC